MLPLRLGLLLLLLSLRLPPATATGDEAIKEDRVLPIRANSSSTSFFCLDCKAWISLICLLKRKSFDGK